MRTAKQLIVFRTARHLSTRPDPQVRTATEAASHMMERFAHKVTKRSQYIDSNQLQKLAVTLGRPVLDGHDTRRMGVPAGTPVPPAHHLVYFTPDDVEADLGADGSDRTFNAPAPFTRRMWAGGHVKFDTQNPLRVGDEAEEHTKLISAVAKTSRSAGEMVLVEVEKKLYGSRGLTLVDTRSWVFRPVIQGQSNARGGVALRVVDGNILAPSSVSDVVVNENPFPIRKLSWSPVGLFRFSALTFNGHKIHYNEDWTRTAEGHPVVVVHGPLNVISLLDYWRDVHGEGTGPDEISYRAVSPVYAGEEYQIRTVDILVTHDGQVFEVVAEKDGVHGVPVPRAILAQTPLEARDAVKALGKSCILRAQVLHGHLDKLLFEDGLRGGIHTVDSPEQGLDVAAQMLNRQAMSENIRHRSLTVNRVLVSEGLATEEQWYLAMTIDREKYCPMVIISRCDEAGGEGNVSGNNISGKGTSFAFGFSQGITGELVSQISRHLGVVHADKTNLNDILTKAYRMFKETDATLLEINSLARIISGSFTCLDARLVVDDDAAHRQPDLFRLRDTSQEVHDEVRAEQHNLVYIKLNGNIGNIVNGAGLAMATNDAIGLHGGASANFLDAGGQATKETMIQALGIVLGDGRVKAILINIYGGITRCDMIAESIIGAAQEMTLAVPLVVRLQGTNSTQGLKLMTDL
ncbi:hypothetical protein J3F83DRAFT_712766 [Trichoderma novae-zelandiae]